MRLQRLRLLLVLYDFSFVPAFAHTYWFLGFFDSCIPDSTKLWLLLIQYFTKFTHCKILKEIFCKKVFIIPWGLLKCNNFWTTMCNKPATTVFQKVFSVILCENGYFSMTLLLCSITCWGVHPAKELPQKRSWNYFHDVLYGSNNWRRWEIFPLKKQQLHVRCWIGTCKPKPISASSPLPLLNLDCF